MHDTSAQLSSEFRSWAKTPLPEVGLWSATIYVSATLIQELLQRGMVSMAASRLTLDVLSLASIVLVCVIALCIRGRWQPLHTAALGAIMGDQLSAVLSPIFRVEGIYPLWLIIGVSVLCALALLYNSIHRGWLRARGSRMMLAANDHEDLRYYEP
jgi:hypothetical protein